MVNPAEPVIGGLLIELCFAFILYGITTLQTFMYFQKYTDDRPSLKTLVATVWILESVHTGFCMQFIYAYIIAGFGDYANFLNINWCVAITVVCSAGVALCVQGYYTWRVWIVSGKSLVWTVIIGSFALLRVAFGIASAVLSYVYPDWLTFRHTNSSLITISGGLGSAALVDMLVAVTLSYYLKRGRHTWHKESNSMINQILLYAVNTGAITGTASLLCVILFAVKKSSLVFLGLVMIQTKLYANSLLGSLNARAHMRSKGSRGNTYSSASSSGYRVATPRVPVVEVFQQTDILDDRELASQTDLNLENLKGGSLA
ncbi:uncharacterized protein TRAVEDRAFT_72794 [Trametes versicolor FP-101664 SS1]|uniref:uncharacterized protein n=1 Tax=Trametes versicolor (strain FP-101664) TaxID=717944 RepID=UPI0004624329|nr:uncharacterized protein TRAVEDRAFT_72794 [Trametes versicolor FP-101664 SS1]EIW57835.1 hypothetical protein TRAVEDRAFT_72794 [Trametes versicolor FP-101664 SS1]